MFNRTRTRLVLLNTIVFFVLLNCFAAILYVSTQQRLYSQVDESLAREMELISRGFSRFPGREMFFYRPIPQVTFLYWDAERRLVRQVPGDRFEESQQVGFREVMVASAPQTVNIGEAEFRVVTLAAPSGAVVQLAYNLDPEKNVLRNLLFLIGAGGVASLAVAVLAGSFLASRALIPIQKAWDQQQQFVSDASHELRTPLSVLQVNLEQLFRHPERTAAEESRRISVMIDETRRMSKLVADLLTLARSDANPMQLVVGRIDVRELLSRVARQFQDIAAAGGVPIEVTADEPIEMQGDEDQLHQLLVILLDNALKYTKEGRIGVAAVKTGNTLKLTVSDTGIGIAPEELPHIFDRFYRADKVRTRTTGGSGLGLAIAKSIVEAHRGTITAESEPGRGTTIHVHLPVY